MNSNRPPCQSLLALSLGLLAGCGSDRVSGNTVETENTVSARELRIDSLVPAWARPDSGATVATIRLNASDFDFRRSSASGLDLKVERLDSTLLPFETVIWDSATGMGRLRVRIDPTLQRPGSRIRLRWGLPLLQRADGIATWGGIPLAWKTVLTSVAVDDFEHGNLANLLPSPTQWYSSASDSCNVSAVQIGSAGKGRAGNAIFVNYQANFANDRYALIGTRLGSAPRSLRALDSLVFWTRGSGILSLAFDHLRNDTGYKAWTHIMLDTAWTRVRIRPQDLSVADGIGHNIGWTAVRDSVTNLTFLVNGSGSLWIDNVRLYGIDRDDLR
jgi:hypothetical protein